MIHLKKVVDMHWWYSFLYIMGWILQEIFGKL